MGQAMRQVAYAVPARLCPLGIRRASRAMPLAYALLFFGAGYATSRIRRARASMPVGHTPRQQGYAFGIRPALIG